jgi:methyl-accepting chemotaxis protein
MKEEASENQELFENYRDFIDTLENTPDSDRQIDGILYLLKTIGNLLETDNDAVKQHNEVLNYLNDTFAANQNIVDEHEEKITELNELIIRIGDIVNNVTDEIKKLAEHTAKIPVVNVDSLLKTLNEHTEEINDIKRKLY